MRRERTIRREVRLEGVGLHTGRPVRLTIEPAPARSGLVFVRADEGGAEIPALQQYRAPMIHATRLERDGVGVETPEHVLAALFALGVDNARLVLDGPEVPILDGSALPFARALLEAEPTPQEAIRTRLVVTRTLAVADDGKRLEAHPGRGLRVTAGIDFEHRHLGYQELTVDLDDPEDFLMKLAPARTFAMRRDLDRLRQAGLARGGSLDNAILVDEGGVTPPGLRFPDEFVRHKLLDLVGDLALAGCDLSCRIVAWRAGHAVHGRLLDALLADRSAWIVEGDADRPPARPTAPGRVHAE